MVRSMLCTILSSSAGLASVSRKRRFFFFSNAYSACLYIKEVVVWCTGLKWILSKKWWHRYILFTRVLLPPPTVAFMNPVEDFSDDVCKNLEYVWQSASSFNCSAVLAQTLLNISWVRQSYGLSWYAIYRVAFITNSERLKAVWYFCLIEHSHIYHLRRMLGQPLRSHFPTA